ncbi:HHR005Wp [Eremothecium sinecaudum]|uniref:Dolichyl-diphosphooligosaccharide--protein glycosyltransferase subunit 1 n=1 Tax=Eremothecium sinecaudum TaxID=45286 RepID=A0A0X8HWH2_9SACH|nr:HHR005Wp [Eremothecium sinecaudum]AMD22774.1 HHR005Wp [Eremothecium sinecaudum]
MLLPQLLGVFVFLFARFAFGATLQTKAAGTWENVAFTRVVNLMRSYPIETVSLTIKNVGSYPESIYYFGLPDSVFDRISVFSARMPDKNAFIESSLYTQKVEQGGVPVSCGVLKLASPIEPNNTIDLEVVFAYNAGSSLTPYPEHISIDTIQMLHLNTSILPYSLYPTVDYRLEFLGSDEYTVLNARPDVSVKKQGSNKLQIGPIKNTKELTPSSLSLVYKHNLPLTRVVNLNRDIWLSHWANTIQFEEYYEVTNDAAKLKGGFSRAEFMNGEYTRKQGTHLLGFEMVLPNESSGHYFTDLVGMVSTFKVFSNRLYLRPRYPLFGGWFYNFTVGWTNELSQFLHSPGEEEHILRVPLLNGPNDIFYDNVKLSFYLPEGASIVSVESPVPIKYKLYKYEKSYLDLNAGRSKVVIGFKNLIDNARDESLFVKYKYSKTNLYMKPLSISLYIFCALMAYFLLKQINLSIEP